MIALNKKRRRQRGRLRRTTCLSCNAPPFLQKDPARVVVPGDIKVEEDGGEVQQQQRRPAEGKREDADEDWDPADDGYGYGTGNGEDFDLGDGVDFDDESYSEEEADSFGEEEEEEEEFGKARKRRRRAQGPRRGAKSQSATETCPTCDKSTRNLKDHNARYEMSQGSEPRRHVSFSFVLVSFRFVPLFLFYLPTQNLFSLISPRFHTEVSCELCQKVFTGSQGLQCHQRAVHPELSPRKASAAASATASASAPKDPSLEGHCGPCNKFYSDLAKHNSKNHTPGKEADGVTRGWPCAQCLGWLEKEIAVLEMPLQ